MFSCEIVVQCSVGTLRELLTVCGITQSFKKNYWTVLYHISNIYEKVNCSNVEHKNRWTRVNYVEH
jgi:hypothetical protein